MQTHLRQWQASLCEKNEATQYPPAQASATPAEKPPLPWMVFRCHAPCVASRTSPPQRAGGDVRYAPYVPRVASFFSHKEPCHASFLVFAVVVFGSLGSLVRRLLSLPSLSSVVRLVWWSRFPAFLVSPSSRGCRAPFSGCSVLCWFSPCRRCSCLPLLSALVPFRPFRLPLLLSVLLRRLCRSSASASSVGGLAPLTQEHSHSALRRPPRVTHERQKQPQRPHSVRPRSNCRPECPPSTQYILAGNVAEYGNETRIFPNTETRINHRAAM